MKKSFLLLNSVVIVLILSACVSNPAIDDNKAIDNVEENVSHNQEKVIRKDDEIEVKEDQDIWTYYENATWSDNFNGLITEIQKVVVSDRAPNPKSDSYNPIFNASAVGVKFRIENTTEGVFTTYPDQARLVTSTGEQIENPNIWLSDHLGGEIEKGVIKEGNVIWFLNCGHAEDITWVKFKWIAHVGDGFDGERKEYDIELQLK